MLPFYQSDQLARIKETILQTDRSNLLAGWMLDEKSGTVAKDFVRNGGNILLNGGFEIAGTGGADVFANCTEVITGGTIENEVTVVHGGIHALKITRTGVGACQLELLNISVVPGTTYIFSFWTKDDGTNCGKYFIWDATHASYLLNVVSIFPSGTNYRKITGTFIAPVGCTVVTFVLLACPVTNTTVYYDDVQIIAPPNIGIYNGTYNGPTLAQAKFFGYNVPSFDGVNDNVNVLSNALINNFNLNEGTFIQFVKFPSSILTDGVVRYFYFLGLPNNAIICYKNASNVFYIVKVCAGISKAYSPLLTANKIYMLATTFSQSQNFTRHFVNGIRVYNDTCPVSAGPLTTCNIYSNIGNSNYMVGNSGPVAIWNHALSDQKIKAIWQSRFN